MKRKLSVIHFLSIVLAFSLLAGYKISNAAPPDGSKTVMVSTFAGGGATYPESGDFADGTGSAARFMNPRGITIDASDNLYVVDSNRIRKVSPKGEVSTLAGSDKSDYANGIRDAARFNVPYSIAVDASGNLYVADMANHRIRKVSPKGEVSTLAGDGKYGFADGTGSAAKFAHPCGIAVDAAGNLYVADRDNHRIRKVSPKGEVSTFVGGKYGFAEGTGSAARFAQPCGIAIDTVGNLYVADGENYRVRKVTPKGEVSTLASGRGKQGFASPFGITIDKAGNVYITAIASSIYKITQDGKVRTLAGSGPTDSEAIGFADGPGNTARFAIPGGIAIDKTGNLYVADEGNMRIRKLVFVTHSAPEAD